MIYVAIRDKMSQRLEQEQRGALGFHRLRISPILALGFRDSRLNRSGFRVLRCVAARRFGNFVFGHLIQNSYFFGFSKSYSPCGIEKAAFECLK